MLPPRPAWPQSYRESKNDRPRVTPGTPNGNIRGHTEKQKNDRPAAMPGKHRNTTCPLPCKLPEQPAVKTTAGCFLLFGVHITIVYEQNLKGLYSFYLQMPIDCYAIAIFVTL